MTYYPSRTFRPDEIFFAAAKGMGIKHPMYHLALSLEENLNVNLEAQELCARADAEFNNFIFWLENIYLHSPVPEQIVREHKKGIFARLKDFAFA